MKISSAINWMITWMCMSVLKRSLHPRLKGAGAAWLQKINGRRPQIVNRIDFILAQCRARNVLHIGFTDHPYTMEKLIPGTLLHSRLKEVCASLAGLDIDQISIDAYVSHTNDMTAFQGDIMQAYPQDAILFQPEIILLSEVLEHLPDPYKAINILHESFGAGTRVLVTVPNYTALDHIAASLHQTESIHPHHHWYFSPYTLQQLFDKDRFLMEQLDFGMYYQAGSRVNAYLRNYPFNGDCIIAVFTILKKPGNA